MVADFSIRIERGDRIGIVGPNGSGKTTLVNLLIGALAPDSGTVRLGANLQMATLDQRRESLNPDWTVAEALTGGGGDTVMIGGQARHVVGYMRDFLFAPEQARTPLRVLSGGERGRLMLARALAKPSNVLVLDEPTNDLDLETLDVLEEMLGDYAGTVLLISHDRDFLDRIVEAVIVPEGNGKWIEYAGGYTDMLAQRGADVRRARPASDGRPKASRRAAKGPKPCARAGGAEREAQARLQREARARRRCRARSRHWRPRSRACSNHGRSHPLCARPRRLSSAPRRRSPRRRRNSPRRRNDGSSWNCCAAKSRMRELRPRGAARTSPIRPRRASVHAAVAMRPGRDML